MKKFKFEKPFALFKMAKTKEYSNMSLKEHWRIALHDPAYLILWGGLLILGITLLIYYIIK